MFRSGTLDEIFNLAYAYVFVYTGCFGGLRMPRSVLRWFMNDTSICVFALPCGLRGDGLPFFFTPTMDLLSKDLGGWFFGVVTVWCDLRR